MFTSNFFMLAFAIVVSLILWILNETLKIIYKNKYEKTILEISKKLNPRGFLVLLLIFTILSLFTAGIVKSCTETKHSQSQSLEEQNSNLPLPKPVEESPEPSHSDTPKDLSQRLDTANWTQPTKLYDTIEEQIKVKFIASSETEIHKGDTVQISAAGTIEQDAIVYKTFGLDSTFMAQNGVPISSYGPNGLKSDNAFILVVNRFKYGALLVKVGDDIWKLCGDGLSFVADQDGLLTFLINSRKRQSLQDDQYFAVKLLVRRMRM